MAEVSTPTPVPSDTKCQASGKPKPKLNAPDTQIEVSKQTMAHINTLENGNVLVNAKPKKIKPSAIRDFPHGCGRYAARITLNNPPNPNTDATSTLNPNPNPHTNNNTSPPTHEAQQQQMTIVKQPETSAPTPDSNTSPLTHEAQQQQMTIAKQPETSAPTFLPIHDEQQDQMLIDKQSENPSSGPLPAQLQTPEVKQPENPSTPPTSCEQAKSIVEEVEYCVLEASEVSPHASPTAPETPICILLTESVSTPSTPEMEICPLLTEPRSPSTAPIKFPKRFVSTVRDFPFGCGRNAAPTTREECLRAAAALKARKMPAKQRPIEHTSPTSKQASVFSSPAPNTNVAENQLDLTPKDSETIPIPQREELGNSQGEGKNLLDGQALIVLTDHNAESSETSEVNDRIANGGTESMLKASPPLEEPANSPDEETDGLHGQSLVVSTDRQRFQAKFESSQSPKVNHNISNSGSMVNKHKKKIPPAQKKKPKVETANFADSQAKNVDNEIDLGTNESKATPKSEDPGVKMEEENLPDGQGLIESSPIPLRSQSKPKRSQISNGGTTANKSKKKTYAEKSKVQSVSFALTPTDSTYAQARSDGDGTVTRSKVRETMRLFQVLCRKYLQEEENHAKEAVKGRRRPDIMASKVLKENNKWVNTGKQIVGSVPGVEVGDEFHYRIELCIVGLHRQSQGGIDYLKQGNTIMATSIVASGGYAGDVDTGEVLIYTGQGGNNSSADKKGQPEDQKLERGNLSLKNCIDAKSPVRVIRGIKDSSNGIRGGKDGTKSKMGITYTYDGLYLVEKYWQESGASGFSVFKFQLRRMPGQPQLAWNILKSVGRSKKGAPREGLCLQDISQGKETRLICVVNTADDEAGPAPFEYTANIIYPSWFNPPPPRGCDCLDGCSDSEKCFCAVKNGGELPYNYNGAIVEAKPIVYECGPSCKCPPTCHNRVSQHGVRINLEIFKTGGRGWGVRSLSSISSGSFICEYTGELLSDMEAEQRGNDEYLFDIGRSNDQSLWDGLSGLVNELPSHSIIETVEDTGYTIDAAKYGSVGRFINHSCSPNLYAQNVLYDHDDKNIPHIMLFAAENIPPLQELCYHYNYSIDNVRDSDGNIKKKNCYCGSSECTGRLY